MLEEEWYKILLNRITELSILVTENISKNREVTEEELSPIVDDHLETVTKCLATIMTSAASIGIQSHTFLCIYLMTMMKDPTKSVALLANIESFCLSHLLKEKAKENVN